MNSLFDEIEELLEFLYQENEEKANEKLVALLPQIEQSIQKINRLEIQQQAMQGLLLVMQAMETEDMTLMADYLKYEVVERIAEA